MSIRRQIRNFWRAFRSNKGARVSRHGGHSLANTLRDSTHVRGGSQGMGLGRAGTEQQHKIVAEGHENYTESFKDEK